MQSKKSHPRKMQGRWLAAEADMANVVTHPVFIGRRITALNDAGD